MDHAAHMAAPAKKQFRRTLLKEWRSFRGLTQEQLAEQADISHSHISMLERGERGYSQEMFEVFATILKTTPASLISRHPTEDDKIWNVWEEASPAEKKAIVESADTIMRLRSAS